jgi:CRP-like cAMP-binding protein
MAKKATQALGYDPQEIAEYVVVLRQADTFSDLTDPQLEMVAHLCTDVLCRANEAIVQEAGVGEDLFVIANGLIAIEVSPDLVRGASEPATNLTTIATLRRGQTFGEIALVDHGMRSATARCISRKARLLRISSARLLKMCDNYPELGYVLMRNIARDLAFKLRTSGLTIREQLIRRPR